MKVDVRGTEDANDLVACLSSELGLTGAHIPIPATKQHVIFEPSEVVAFQLVREHMLPTYDAAAGAKGRTERTTFRYPPHVYLDQFLAKNLARGNELREKQRNMNTEIEQLTARRLALTRHKVWAITLSLCGAWANRCFTGCAGQGHPEGSAIVGALL